MIFKKENEINLEDYIVVDYYLASKTSLKTAAWELAIGQSVGNPNVRNRWETDELFEKHSAIVLTDENELLFSNNGYVKIGFPKINLDWNTDGISQLLCFMMGGQMDIDNIIKCQAIDIQFPKSISDLFKTPKFGLSGFRQYTNTYNKPFFNFTPK